jgi:hypothetical protein
VNFRFFTIKQITPHYKKHQLGLLQDDTKKISALINSHQKKRNRKFFFFFVGGHIILGSQKGKSEKGESKKAGQLPFWQFPFSFLGSEKNRVGQDPGSESSVLRESCLMTGAYTSSGLKSTPGTCEKPLATKRALNIFSLVLVAGLTLNVHLD